MYVDEIIMMPMSDYRKRMLAEKLAKKESVLLCIAIKSFFYLQVFTGMYSVIEYIQRSHDLCTGFLLRW